MMRILTASLALGIALSFVADAAAQTSKPPVGTPAFEVVSVKHTGNMMDGTRTERGRTYARPLHGPEFKGAKLTAVNNLGNIIAFAFAPLVKERRFDELDWLYFECYTIDAIAPPGTTIEGAQAMLRNLLVERLGLKYRLTDKETPIYALVRGSGKLQLNPAANGPNSGAMRIGTFKRNSASLADLAGYLSTLTDRQVLDRTGIEGSFQFDLDWSKEMLATMHEFGPHGDPAIVFAGLKGFGLKLEARKEPVKTMMIDRVNREPTAN